MWGARFVRYISCADERLLILMQDELARFLWRRRMSARLKMIQDVFRLVVDFWTALYIIVPAIILLIAIYRDLLAGLPAWFHPQWAVFFGIILSLFMVRGEQRCYLTEADLNFHHPRSKRFYHLFRLGMLSSVLINNIIVLLLIIALFPFYMHLEAVSLQLWLGIGLWIILLRTTFLLILFRLQERKRQIVFRLLYFSCFIMIWNRIIMPFIHTGDSTYLTMLLGIAFFTLLLVLLAERFWPIKNWEKVIRDEANYNIRLMSQLLGYNAKPIYKRNGASIWSQMRFGIPFQQNYVLTYFYMKYIIRQKPILQIFMEIFAFCLLVVFTSGSFWFSLGFLAAADFMLGLLVKSVVADDAGKLDQYTLGLGQNARRNGVRMLYLIMMLPLVISPVFAGLAGTMNGLEVIAGIIILLVWAFVSSQLLLKFTGIKQYLNRK